MHEHNINDVPYKDYLKTISNTNLLFRYHIQSNSRSTANQRRIKNTHNTIHTQVSKPSRHTIMRLEIRHLATSPFSGAEKRSAVTGTAAVVACRPSPVWRSILQRVRHSTLRPGFIVQRSAFHGGVGLVETPSVAHCEHSDWTTTAKRQRAFEIA